MIILISQIVGAASSRRQSFLLLRVSDEYVFLTKLIFVRALFDFFTGVIVVLSLPVLVES